MKHKRLGHLLATITLAWIVTGNSWSADTDPNTIWPLCGRIAESPPVGWLDMDGCPAERFGDPAFSDEPLNATFGPRPLFSENNRYDFHRGVDIATPIGTPFFAITDGMVEIAGNHPSYTDSLIKLRHFRPGENSCNAGGCYHSYYLHIDSWVVDEDDVVVKGQLLGYTGASGSGFEHVHFEVRDAPDFDIYSAWSRDAIHPLQVVPYAAPNISTIQFNSVDFTDLLAGIVDLTVTSNRYDLVRVGLILLDEAMQPIPQPGDTPDELGYFVGPPFFDMELWNLQYSHKDSTAYPWSSFGAGGANECPYHADHGSSYNANVHMDQQDPIDFHDGLFNGLHVRTQKYWPSDVHDYTVDLEFLALEGAPACVQATATFASGDTAFGELGSCSGGGNQPPNATFSYGTSGLTANFLDASSDSDGSVASWIWDFDDGNGSTAQNPSHNYATAGTYTVSLTVTDDVGATDITSQSVTVTDPAASLSVDSITPNAAGLSVTVNVTVYGSGIDPLATLSFSGGSGPTPLVSNVSVSVPNSLTATVQIRDGGPNKTRSWDVAVTNPDGSSATLPDGFTVYPKGLPANTPPIVTITAPADGAVFTEGDSVSFTGTANDAEDGDLSGSIGWTSSLDLAIGSGASVSTILSVGTHAITAAVTDFGGLVDSDSISVTVNPAGDAPPVVTITAPADGAVFTEGDSVSFTGTANDAEDGDLSGSIGWTSSLDLVIGSGASVSTILSVGTHTITAVVTDSASQTGSDSISITVQDPPAGLSVTSVSPNVSRLSVTVDVTVYGSGFVEGVSLSFSGGNGPTPVVSDVSVSGDGNSLTARVQIREGGPPRQRQWDVTVTNPDGSSATLAAGFTVNP